MSADQIFDEFEDIDGEPFDEKDERRREYARKHSHTDIRENEIDPVPTPKGKPIPEDDWEVEVDHWDDDFDDLPPNIWELDDDASNN